MKIRDYSNSISGTHIVLCIFYGYFLCCICIFYWHFSCLYSM